METRRDYTDELGSPPRGRGKGRLSILSSTATGITPAWAGKSIGGSRNTRDGKDHPRMGGEKATGPALKAGPFGSPPHGRGKVKLVHLATVLVGITPAWAGKSAHKAGMASHSKDHPRMGGEKRQNLGPHSARKGSPPHGRGKAFWNKIPWGQPGITPAWAGKSVKVGLAVGGFGDHPRMGGEKQARKFLGGSL